MRLPWHRHNPEPPPDPDARLSEAEEQVEQLERRAESVQTYLRARNDRNHWAESIAETFRRAT